MDWDTITITWWYLLSSDHWPVILFVNGSSSRSFYCSCSLLQLWWISTWKQWVYTSSLSTSESTRSCSELKLLVYQRRGTDAACNNSGGAGGEELVAHGGSQSASCSLPASPRDAAVEQTWAQAAGRKDTSRLRDAQLWFCEIDQEVEDYITRWLKLTFSSCFPYKDITCVFFFFLGLMTDLHVFTLCKESVTAHTDSAVSWRCFWFCFHACFSENGVHAITCIISWYSTCGNMLVYQWNITGLLQDCVIFCIDRRASGWADNNKRITCESGIC